MTIYKKRIGNAFVLLFCLVGLLMFFIFSGMALVTERPASHKIIFFLFFVISTAGLWSCWKAIQKLFSANPEFELTEKELIIYDNPEYNRISFRDMMDCDIFRSPRNNVLIGISLTPNAPLKSNSFKFQKWYFNVPPEKSKIIFISLGFADIEPEELSRLIKLRIGK